MGVLYHSSILELISLATLTSAATCWCDFIKLGFQAQLFGYFLQEACDNTSTSCDFVLTYVPAAKLGPETVKI